MSTQALITRACTIEHRRASGATDDYGNEQDTISTVSTVCEVQQIRRSERDEQGEISTTEWVAFFLPGEDLTTADALLVDGEIYEFVGEPWLARNPRTQTVEHIESTLRRVVGS